MREPGGSATERSLKLAAFILIAACWVGIILSVWMRVDGYQGDFKTYYYAGQAFGRGLNPYRIGNLVAVADPDGHPLRFAYPLSTLYLLKPFSALDYATAHRVWLMIKVAALVGLLAVWKHEFLKGTGWLWILTVSLLAFQAATLWDIRSGNVAIIEQLFLWLGFALLMRSRRVAFAACMVAASFFKLTLSAFLLLLLLPQTRGRRSVLIMSASYIILGALTLGSFLGHPGYLHEFIASASVTPAWFSSNPSLFGVSTELVRRYPGLFGSATWLPYVLTLVLASAVLVAGRRLIGHALFRSGSLLLAILVACVCYAIVMPRMMIYSYMILLVPTLGLVLPVARRCSIAAYAVAAFVCLDGLKVLPSSVGSLLDDCEPLLVLLACWFFLVIANSKGMVIGPEEGPPGIRGARHA